MYPEDKVVFKNLRLYAGDTPIFWLPYLSQPLDGELGYHFVPGARSNWGVFLLNSYGIMLGGDPAAPEGSVNAEPRLPRTGASTCAAAAASAPGSTSQDTRTDDNPNLTGLSLYYANDLNPDVSRTGLPREHQRGPLSPGLPAALPLGVRTGQERRLARRREPQYPERQLLS